MSYLFDGAGDDLAGSFASTYSEPLTVACFFKVTDHPLATDCLMALGVADGVVTESYSFRTSGTDNQWRLLAADSAGATSGSDVIAAVDNVWTPLVGLI